MEGREHTYNSGRIRRAHTIPGLDTSAIRKRLYEQEFAYESDYGNEKKYDEFEAYDDGQDDYDDEYGYDDEDYIDTPPKRAKKKRRAWPVVLVVVLVIIGLVAGGLGALYMYLDNVFEPGMPGTIAPEHATPEEYKGDVVNILIVGIDNEEGRGYGSGLGQTDMILYMNYVLRDNKLNMLQIPRDSYVGEISGSNGKINSLLITGSDKDNPINNVASVIADQYKLPIDHYISMDMDALRAIVDHLGPLKVYVPRDMSYGGSSLEQGWQWLDSNSVEFFVRNRHGTGFERADIDRLDNQRHFYSALFRRFMNLTPKDIVKLLPVFEYYCNTDLGLTVLGQIAVSALKLDANNVLFCKVPGATGGEVDPTGQGRDFYYVDAHGKGTEEDPGVANLLNQYFRTIGEQVPASELSLPTVNITGSTSLYSPNVQMMGQVQKEEGGADVYVEPH